MLFREQNKIEAPLSLIIDIPGFYKSEKSESGMVGFTCTETLTYVFLDEDKLSQPRSENAASAEQNAVNPNRISHFSNFRVIIYIPL